MTDRRFEIGQAAWHSNRFARVIGYEDGRHIGWPMKYDGWLYWIRVEGTNGASTDEWVKEEELSSVTETQPREMIKRRW